MKKMMLYLDEDMHEALRRLSFEKKVPMAKLVRYAIDSAFEDEMDAIRGELALEEAKRDPSSLMTLEEYLRSSEIELPASADPARAKGSRTVATGRPAANRRGAQRAGRATASARSAQARR